MCVADGWVAMGSLTERQLGVGHVVGCMFGGPVVGEAAGWLEGVADWVLFICLFGLGMELCCG